MGQQLCGGTESEVFRAFYFLHWAYLLAQVGWRTSTLTIHFIINILIFSIFLGTNHFISCIHGDWKTCTVYSPPATVVLILFLLFEVSISVDGPSHLSAHLYYIFRVFCSPFSHPLCLEPKCLQFGTMRLVLRHSKKKR
jgi:hypothetical protein